MYYDKYKLLLQVVYRNLVFSLLSKVLEPNKTHSADNELLAQMLEVMERLAAYAYFWDVSEIEFDFSSLVRILDTRTDNYPNSKLYWRNE